MASVDALVESLKEQEFFSSLSDDSRKTFVAATANKTYKAGDVLVTQGEPQMKMFIIREGSLIKKRGTRETTLKRGEISGLLHVFSADPSAATIIVSPEGATLSEIETSSLRKLLASNQTLNDQFISFLSREVRSKCNTITDIRTSIQGATDGVHIAFFDAKGYMREAFEKANKKYNFKFSWFKEKLSSVSAVLAAGSQVACCFVNDNVGTDSVQQLSTQGVQLIAMRCAGYDNVDFKTCTKLGLSVTRVPAYSPYAVAEFAVSLLLGLNRKTHKSFCRTREHNFSLSGLVGFDLYGKTVGVLGTGKIGKCLINIVRGFGCNVLAYDVRQDPELVAMAGVKYTTKDDLLANSDVVSLHAPLLPSTHHTINADALSKMKPTALLINTSRGGLVDSQALLDAILANKIAGAALDVYEGEKEYFFENRSDKNISDTVLTRLIACHNVLVTSHQAFLTQEALQGIAESTLNSITEFAQGKRGDQLTNAVKEEYK